MQSFFDLLHNVWSQLQSGQLPQLGVWSYVLLALLVLVEGPVATLLGAAAASARMMRPGLVFAAAAIGNLTADLIWYGIGRAGRVHWLLPYGRWLGLRREHLDRLMRLMNSHARKVLFLAKLLNAFIVPSLMAAGLARVPLRRWLPAVLIAETLWTGSLVLIGYHATQAISRVELGLQYLALAASILVILALLFLGRQVLRRRANLQDLGDDQAPE